MISKQERPCQDIHTHEQESEPDERESAIGGDYWTETESVEPESVGPLSSKDVTTSWPSTSLLGMMNYYRRK